MKITFTAEALHDIKHAIDWYIDQGALSAAIGVQAEVSLAVRRASAEPGIGTPGPHGTRLLPVHRFPLSLVYEVAGDLLTVVAVAAQRRRPGYWTSRRS
jgi:plasmid stabilization system protein ParE